MSKDWKYIIYLSAAFGLFVAVKLLEPRQYDWTPTYAVEDKNPFGAFVLHQLVGGLFPGRRISVDHQTLYELKDSLSNAENIIILTHYFECDKQDAGILLKHASGGATVFVAAQSFYGNLADTLEISTSDYLFKDGMAGLRKDTSYLKFANPHLDSTARFLFKRDNVHNYFATFDSTRTSIIAVNDFHQPVALRIRWGKGNIVLCCAPLAFTNIYMIRGNHERFASGILSYLPGENVRWIEYYSIGRMEAGSPLRFILTREPLAWAYYLTLVSLLIFIFFESRRKQRIIPIIPPLQNTSLEFVGTIGNLYYQRGDHKNIAEKKIIFFLEQIRSRYSLAPAETKEGFARQLAGKAGKTEDEVTALFSFIATIRSATSIRAEDLVKLNRQIEIFWKP